MNLLIGAGCVWDFTVHDLVPANNTERGRRSFELRPWEGMQGVEFSNPQTTYYYRTPHEICGGHCHRGDNPYDMDRNPEQSFILSGNLVVELEDLFGGKRTVGINVEPGHPKVLSIPTWVLHTFHVGDKGLHFIEPRRTPFSKEPEKQDVVLESEFRAMQESLR